LEKLKDKSGTIRSSILDTGTSYGPETHTISICLFNELNLYSITCCNDNSKRPSTKSWTDKGIPTSESVGGDQVISGRLKSPKTIKWSLLKRRYGTDFIADRWCL